MADPANAAGVVVTGASGFIGRHIVEALGPARAIPVSVRAGDDCREKISQMISGRTVSALIHAGGRAHANDRDGTAAEAAHMRDNLELTRDLAKAAADLGICRFIFVSTIHVLATRSSPGHPICADDTPAPRSPYARAKHAAEQALAEISRNSALEVAIVRPTLVYGAGAKGNIARLANAIEAGIPLPFGAIHNRRSLMNVTDLADLLVLLTQLDSLPQMPLIAADAEPVSTSELIRTLADVLQRQPRLIPIPPALLRLAFRLIGQAGMAERLLSDFEVDTTATTAQTQWRPKQGLRQGLEAMTFGESSRQI